MTSRPDKAQQPDDVFRRGKVARLGRRNQRRDRRMIAASRLLFEDARQVPKMLRRHSLPENVDRKPRSSEHLRGKVRQPPVTSAA